MFESRVHLLGIVFFVLLPLAVIHNFCQSHEDACLVREFLSRPRASVGWNQVAEESSSTLSTGSFTPPPASVAPIGVPVVPGTAPLAQAYSGETACHQVDKKLRRGTVPWTPQPNRYLLAMCSAGQFSNRLMCLRQSMLDAALLNRTLVLPTTGIDYNYTDLLDLEAVEECFGAKLVISLKEYRKTVDRDMRVDHFICHVHDNQEETICQQLAEQYHGILGLKFPPPTIPSLRTPNPFYKYLRCDFVGNFSSDHRLVAFGNMFGVGGQELPFDGAAPLIVTESCRNYLRPSKAIQETAIGYVNSYLGTNYTAVHMRRGDFFRHCLKRPGKTRSSPCFRPIGQMGACLAQRLRERPALHMVFLATNADDTEIALLQKVLEHEGISVPVVRLPPMESQQWAQPLVKRSLEKDKVVVSLVEKSVCALSASFLGTWGSSFTGDIFRLRDWWKHESSCDGYVCEKYMPADILQPDDTMI